MEMHNDICMEVVPDTPDRLTSGTTNGSFKSKDINSGAISSQIGGNTRIVNKQISKGQRDSSTIHYVSDASESNMMYSSIACTSFKGDQLPKKPKSKGLIPENHDHPSCDEINSFPLITGNIDSRHFDYRDTDHSLDVEKKDEKHHKHVRFSYRDQVDSKKEKGSLYRKKASPFLERQMGDSSGKKLIAIEPREKFHEVSTSSGNKDINVAETCNDGYKIINLHNICESKGKQTLEKRVYAPATKGKKRLVRNGCISPCNIAKREMNLCNGSVHNVYDRMKGKAIITDMDGVRPELQSSRPKTMEAADSIREINLLSDEENWRSVRKQSSKNCLNTSSHDIISISNKTDDGFQNGIEGSDCIVCANTDPEINLLEDCNSPTFQKKCKDNNKPSSSGLLTSRDVEEVRFHGQKELKQGKWAASHHLSVGKCSNPTSDGSDNYQHVVQVLDVNPDKKDNTLGLVRSRQVIDVDALCSPETSSREHRGENHTSSSGIDKVSRQVEEDELLARQLQEQFYDEFQEMNDPEVQVNARIVIALQQEEDAQYVSSIGSRNSPEYVNSSVTHPPRSYHFGSSRNSSLRSRNRGHIPISTSSRMARLRRNFHGDSIVSSRQRIEFPATLDVFARMDILEALEASVSNNHSVGYAQHFFPGQSDFNENDYEMLLSLDENNPQCGASTSQINGLPQSVVQTEEFEEACTICLEHPCKGDAIRHLPCLHKFHKECIDTWLRRKTSCPVCKTSIT